MSTDRETAPGCWLETMTWVEAEAMLSEGRVVVIPLGAAAKAHGPHLPLNNDALIANWLAAEVAARLPVLVAPLVNASFYPAFVDYPGSISLRPETARDLVVDLCRSLAAHGASRIYVLNTGMSTEGPLKLAQTELEGLQFGFLRLGEAMQRIPDGVLEQGWGSHADEHETSLMLHIAPGVVDMAKAVDDGSEGEGRLSREPGHGTWSPSGVYGQATLATAEKGQAVAEALLAQTLIDLEALISGQSPN
mgnify:CR=1 FL=1